jgi:thiol-disulfide isomerase/thioredoxin
MAKYINFNSNSLPPLSGESTSIFSRVMSAGSAVNTNTMLIIGAVILFASLAIFYYLYYVAPASKSTYHANSEQAPAGSSSNNNSAELMFFYADWCPHCKSAKPIWNDLKTEYENKTINGYKIIFTEVNCSEETAEVEKLMNQYNIEGYPTIKLIKDGQVIEYDAKPSKETLTKFLNTVL